MTDLKIILVTGLPGSGKSTLAREIARRFRMPLVAKDTIKEPLLDVLGAGDAAASRRLSDASFAVLFSMARQWSRSGAPGFLLEGNFRAGEHEAPLLEALAVRDGTATREAAHGLAQVLCRVSEAERIARLTARERDPHRHPGHRAGERLSMTASPPASAASSDAFLDLPSVRLVHDGTSTQTVLDALDDWMNLRAPSLWSADPSEPDRWRRP